jgi:LPS sulfotransferase NodH
MNKFFIMTRGRTGSTAIIDELNKADRIGTAQELFLKYDFSDKPDLLSQLYPLVLPFELWKERGSWWCNIYRRYLNDEGLINLYLKHVEATTAKGEGKDAFGFKVLSHHFEETPFLDSALLKRGYRVLYLTRNIPRQVISGMLAEQRGKYNAQADEGYEDKNRYSIDIEEFRNLVRWESQAVENDIAFLSTAGFNFIEVTYEEFMTDRMAFFRRVLSFLGGPVVLPQASSYSVMIKDMEHSIENYQAVAECVLAMGLRIE